VLLSLPQNRTSESQTRARSCATSEELHPLRPARRWSAPIAVRYWHLASLEFWHLTSLDAPTVAAVWSLAFAWVAGVRLATWVVALQVLTVWTVYVGDRILDARAGLRLQNSENLRERHYFHWRHRRILIPMACIAACAAAWIAVRRMPIGAKERDSLLAAASALYFARVHAGRMRRMLRKEMLVGILFVTGCALPAASPAIAVPAIFFAALTWFNCWVIEKWEAETGKSERVPLLTRRLTRPGPIAIGLAGTGVIIAAILLPFTPRAAAMLAAGALSALLLALLDRASERMTVVTLRALADLVLLTPALLLAAGSLPLGNIFR
jgi:hypothetical protein